MHWTVLYALYTILGFVATVFGPTLPFLITKFSLSLGRAGSLFLLLSLGQVCASGATHGLMSHFGPKRVVFAGLLCLGVGLVMIPLAPQWPLVLASAVIMGIGWGILEVSFNAFVSHWSNDNPGPALNRLHLFFALGAWLGPSIIGVMLMGGIAWQSFFFFVALCYLVSIFVWQAMPNTLFELSDSDPRAESDSQQHTATASREVSLKEMVMAPGILTLGLIMVIYVGVEVSITGWITTFFMRNFSSTAAFGAGVVSFFWAGLTIGRLVCSIISQKMEYLTLMLLLCGGTATAVGLGAIAPSPVSAMLLFALAGFFCSGIFPTIVACGASGYPQWVSPLAGYFSTVAGIGAMLMPWLLGMVADTVGLRTGMVVLSMLMVIAAVLTHLLQRRRHEAGMPAKSQPFR
ncbi:MAG: MFS transporter [Firmicutes bacterium]|nr:MFS transporter [Bacillota bacterium]